MCIVGPPLDDTLLDFEYSDLHCFIHLWDKDLPWEDWKRFFRCTVQAARRERNLAEY